MIRKIGFVLVFIFISISGYSQSLLLDIIKEGNLEKLIKTIELLDADINKIDEKGYTILAYACLEDKNDMVKWLVEHGSDINYIHTTKYITPLTIALANGNLLLGEYLLNSNIDITRSLSSSGETYLDYGMSIMYSRYPKNILATAKLIKQIYRMSELNVNDKIAINESLEKSSIFWAIVDNVDGLKYALQHDSDLRGVCAIAIVTDSVDIVKFVSKISPIEWGAYINSYPFIYNERMALSA